MYCSVCVELSIEADDKGLYGKDAFHMKDAITQVKGTILCYEHAKPFFEKLLKEKTEIERFFNLPINDHD
jgi:hypothetical protein